MQNGQRTQIVRRPFPRNRRDSATPDPHRSCRRCRCRSCSTLTTGGSSGSSSTTSSSTSTRVRRDSDPSLFFNAGARLDRRRRRELLLLSKIHDLARALGERHARHPSGRARLPRCARRPRPNSLSGGVRSAPPRSVQVEQDGDAQTNDMEPPADAMRRDGVHVLCLPAALCVRRPAS